MLYSVYLASEPPEVIEVDIIPQPRPHDDEWFETVLVAAVVKAGYDPELIDDFWDADDA